MYYENGFQYRRIDVRLKGGYEVYYLRDANSKQRTISLNKLKRGEYN